jgi:hypothetical protein
MSTNSYVPPHLRNKQFTPEQPTIEQSPNMERRNPFQKERRAPRRQHEKPFWQIEQEKAKLEAEEKKKAEERGLEKTVENFPALGGSTVTGLSSIWSASRTFSELASEWKSTDDQRKEEEERQKEREKNHIEESRRDDLFQLPRFQNMRRFGEPEDEYYEEGDVQPEQSVPEEEKWTVVERRKYRKPKAEFDFSEDDLDDYNEDEEDGTVWGAPEDHETCWDDRRH